jgi:adenosine deaminase
VQIIIDENEFFHLQIDYDNVKKQITIDIVSYSSITNNFRTNFTKSLSLKDGDNEIKINSCPYNYIPTTDRILIKHEDSDYLEFSVVNNDIKILKMPIRKLCVFETRMIGRHYDGYKINYYDTSKQTITDLHTHLSAQISSKSLIKLGLKHNILYPVSFFDNNNINYKRDNLQKIPKKSFLPIAHLTKGLEFEYAIYFNELTKSQLELLQTSLALSPEFQCSFEDLENCYKLREPFTKDINLLPDMLYEIANQYKEQGVKYSELSTNAIIDPLWLDQINHYIPLIEKDTGVILRFLVGIPRNLSKEKLKERIIQIKKICFNQYIVGVDLLGYEINKTSHLEEKLALLAEWTKVKRPTFTYRIHAGENLKNPTNVKDALLFAMEHNVKIRIGHALHGVDNETLRIASLLCKKNMLIIEFNPDSNLALNNIDYPADVPIKKFIKAGIKFVLGSDGMGTYQTTSSQITTASKICGLEDAELDNLIKTENDYVNSQLKTFSINKNITRSLNQDFNEQIKNKIPILIAGATGSSWLRISKQGRIEIKKCLKQLAEILDPEKVFFITGRSKDKGIAVELGKILTLFNFEHSKKFLFISMVSENSDHVLLKPRGISVIKAFETPLVFLPSGTISYIKKNNGMAIFIGGKSFTRDFILEADKQAIDYLLMDEIEGASMEKARIYKEHSFKTVKDIKELITKKRSDLLQ